MFANISLTAVLVSAAVSIYALRYQLQIVYWTSFVMSRYIRNGRNMLSQCALIPPPPLTEHNLPDQSDKVFIVTGANTGIGKDLSKILYGRNGTVYAAGRDPSKVQKAIDEIKTAHPQSQGKLEILKLDLADLPSIKGSAQEFLNKEKKLHVIWNNAGVMMPPQGSKTPQGYELQIGTNCLGPYLFTELLKPVLEATAASAPPSSVRVAWAGSLAVDAQSPKGGARFDESGNTIVESNPPSNYGLSKAGNVFLAQQFGKEVEGKGIVSVVSVAFINTTSMCWGMLTSAKCFNPGNLKSDLQRHVVGGMPDFLVSAIQKVLTFPSIYGAYTELYCGLSEDITTADNGIYVAPWGRKSFNRTDIEASKKSESEGGTGTSEKFVEYVRRETKAHL